jgi:hypothetical protein
MSIACGVPSNRRAMRLAAYETDRVDPLDNAIGRLTFHVEV